MKGKVPGMYTCSTCGRDFPLIAEENYVVRGSGKRGLQTVFADNEEKMFSAFDCPHCGCQNVVAVYLRPVTAGDLGCEEDCPESCEDCFSCGHEECGCHEGERSPEEGASDGE